MLKDEHYYPHLEISCIKNPNRFYAFPILGGLVKVILLIPVFIELYFVVLLASLLTTINAFYVVANGKYWETAYTFNHKAIIFATKVQLFLFGLTNTYPGFDFQIHDSWKLEIPKLPTHPVRGFAFPLFGFLARIILLIPYLFFTIVMGHAAFIAAVLASFPVCFKGYYPESLNEFITDNTRVSLSSLIYLFGMSDSYPSFWISPKHLNTKIALLIAGTLLALFHAMPITSHHHSNTNVYYYRHTPPMNNMLYQTQPVSPQPY